MWAWQVCLRDSGSSSAVQRVCVWMCTVKSVPVSNGVLSFSSLRSDVASEQSNTDIHTHAPAHTETRPTNYWGRALSGWALSHENSERSMSATAALAAAVAGVAGTAKAAAAAAKSATPAFGVSAR